MSTANPKAPQQQHAQVKPRRGRYAYRTTNAATNIVAASLVVAMLLAAAATVKTAPAVESVGTFVRWGSVSCPSATSTLVYAGIMAGSHYEHGGSGYNKVCLHPEPEYPSGYSDGNQNGARLYGTEYQNTGNSGTDKNQDHDAACAVCVLKKPGTTYVQWGRSKSCSNSHTTLYTGLVMAERYTQRKGEYICVDTERASHPRSSTGNDNGSLLYTTETEAGSMDETLYPPNREVGCSVCAAPAEVFTRWGSNTCPDSTSPIYAGIMAGSRYTHGGSGANQVCLHPQPQYPSVKVLGIWWPVYSDGNQDGALLYGTEYQNTGNAGTDYNQDHDAACAVCVLKKPGTTYVQWGRSKSCSNSHTTLYTGLVMAERYTHRSKSKFICVDTERATHPRSSTNDHNGNLLYTTETEQGSMDEYVYPHNREVGCSVCAAPAEVFTRWGSNTCPDSTSPIYAGIMAGSHYTHGGSGANQVCLHPQPQYPSVKVLGRWYPAYSDGNQDGALLYGTEYQNTGVLDKNHEHDAACAVCLLQKRGTTYVQWGRSDSCSNSHTTLYTGLVMAEKYTHSKSEFVCVDTERATHPRSSTNDHNGNLLYTTEAERGSMDDTLYLHDREVGCSVCMTPEREESEAYFQPISGVGTYNSFFGVCDAGMHYVSGRYDICKQCSLGQYSLYGSIYTKQYSCLQKIVSCSKGQYLVQYNTKTRNDVCRSCAAGQFNAATTATSCTSKTDRCGAGLYLFKFNTAIQNDECMQCAGGTYKVGTTTDVSCQRKKLTCTGGTYLKKHDTKQDDECLPCDAGAYKTGTTAETSCTQKTGNCPSGQFLVKHDVAVRDDACTSCACAAVCKNKATANCYWAEQCNTAVPGLRASSTYQHYSWHYTGGTERCSDSPDCGTCTDKNCGQASGTGYFKSGTNAQLFCNRKAITCPAGEFLIKDTAVVTQDDECRTCATGWYKDSDGPGVCMADTTTCGQGEQISALNVQQKRECSDCRINSYQEQTSHANTECTPCDEGTFTEGSRSTAKQQCKAPRVQMYASTHRVWYFFTPSVQKNTECMRVTLQTQDSSEVAGAPSARQPAASPMCDTKWGITNKYLGEQYDQSFSWNGFPLNVQSESNARNLLAISALPGQTVHSSFMSYGPSEANPQTELEALYTITKGTATKCGCVDYTALLPTTCSDTDNGTDTGVVVVEILRAPGDALPLGTLQVIPLNGNAGPQRAKISHTGPAGWDDFLTAPIRRMVVSSTPSESFRCFNDFTPPVNGAQMLRVASKAAVASLTACASMCARQSTEEAARNCHAFAYNSSNKRCSRFFMASWVPPSDNTLNLATAPAGVDGYCVRTSRAAGAYAAGSGWEDVAARYTVVAGGADTSTVQVAGLPSALSDEVATVVLLGACKNNHLPCPGGACSRAQLLAAFENGMAARSQQLLETPAEQMKKFAVGEDEFKFGCGTSSTSGQLEDCVMPDPLVLSDLGRGYYFVTDTTGRPDALQMRQWRGRMFFSWRDSSLCEQAFSLSRQHGPLNANANIGATSSAGMDLGWSEEETFVDDHYVQGPEDCGVEHKEPTGFFDDLSGQTSSLPSRALGLDQRYCLEAVSSQGAAALTSRSTQACGKHRVFFESTLVGRVVARGTSLPVAGVMIDWAVTGSSLNGSVTSDDAGHFEIHILDDSHEIWTQVLAGTRKKYDAVDVVADVKKGNDPFGCQTSIATLCGGKDTVTNEHFPPIAVGEPGVEGGGARFTWKATYMKFDHDSGDVVLHSIIHSPIASLDGRLYFPMHYHLFEQGDRVSAATAPQARESTLPYVDVDAAGAELNRCFINTLLHNETTAVCLHDYDAGEGVIKCTGSDHLGRYHLAAPLNSRVFVQVSYGDHTFELDVDNMLPNPQQRELLAKKLPKRTAIPGMPTDAWVLTVHPAHKNAFSSVNLQDTTGQIMSVDTHGTHCRLGLGEEAVYTVRVPYTRHVCTPSNEIEIAVPMGQSTRSRLMLPGQLSDVTLEALAPAWPEVTDFGELGYLHRRRNRTQRFDLLAVSKERLARARGSTDGAATAAVDDQEEPAAEFEYHPAASLAFRVTKRSTHGAVNSITCQTAEATDADLAAADDEYAPMDLREDGKVPTWVVKKGTVVDVQVLLTEKVPYPLPETNGLVPPSQVCDWVELDATGPHDAPVEHPVHVVHTSRLGLSNEDLIALDQDENSAEYKEFSTVLTTTLPGLDVAQLDNLKRCTQEGADPERCTLLSTSTDQTAYTDSFGPDHRCLVQAAGALLADYTPVFTGADVTDDLQADCRTAWDAHVLSRPTEYRVWPTPFGALTQEEQELWKQLPSEVLLAYQQCEDCEWGEFSEGVYVQAYSVPWSGLPPGHKQALARLHFTEETWGRHWALLERIFHGATADMPLQWDSGASTPGSGLTALEQEAMASLGWDGSDSWGDDLQAPGRPEHQWEDLTDDQRNNLTQIRVTGQHWNRMLELTEPVRGCFWHQGQQAVRTTQYIKSSTRTATARRQRREDAAANAAAADPAPLLYIQCPPGMFSDPDSSYSCTACAQGFYKSTVMADAYLCSAKRTSCENSGHQLFSPRKLFGRESTTADDTVCPPAGYCPAGSWRTTAAGEAGYTCTACPAGTFSPSITQAAACTAKTLLLGCPVGHFWIRGTSHVHDDNLCVVCPPGTYQDAATNCTAAALAQDPGSCSTSTLSHSGTVCLPKPKPKPCPAGSFLTGGQSTTAPNDSACTPCPAGQYAPETHDGRSCQAKEIHRCAAGQYFHTQNSMTEDDNRCLACPPGTFSASTSSSVSCKPKSPIYCGTVGHYLHTGHSATQNDNACVPDGFCALGYARGTGSGASGDGCEKCAVGFYSNTVDVNTTTCSQKFVPGACPAGKQQKSGDSVTSSDAYCAACPHGTYNDGSFAGCRFKHPHQTECPAGHRTTAYTSATQDDSQCRICPHGQYSDQVNTTRTQCTPKSPPQLCGKGQFLISTLPEYHLARSTGAACFGPRHDDTFVLPAGATVAAECSTLREAKHKCAASHNCTAIVTDAQFCNNSGLAESVYRYRVTHAPVGHAVVLSSAAENTSTTENAVYVLMNPSVRCGPSSDVPTKAIATVAECKQAASALGFELDGWRYYVWSDVQPAGCWRDPNDMVYFNGNTSPSKPGSAPRSICELVEIKAGYSLDRACHDSGLSTTADDWRCNDCPAGKFTAEANVAPQCTLKTTQDGCGHLVLKPSGSSENDNTCHVAGRCKPGQQVDADGINCESCPSGTFNRKYTQSKTACEAKPLPKRCDAGHYLALGVSTERNDWRCARCPVGRFNSAPFDTDTLTNLDADLPRCTKKVKPSSSDPSTYVSLGESIVVNDWELVPHPIVVTMCKKDFKDETQSTLEDVMIGMPELVGPFTKAYSASVRTPAYSRVKKKMAVVVTGSRFVSKAESVPIPQSRPLVIIHDPPGGASFSTYANTHAKVVYKNTDESDLNHATWSASYETPVGFEHEVKIAPGLMGIAAPMGVGVGQLWTLPNDKMEASGSIAPKFETSGSALTAGEVTRDSELENKLVISFTYSTSADPDKAGPPSDVFLVPSVWFEVHKTWYVAYSTCKITGYMGINLVANHDLSGFAFTTANDVETRTLPLLKQQRDAIAFRQECIASETACCRMVPPAGEEDEGSQINDPAMGCAATTLPEYCDFKYGDDRTQDAWQSCAFVEENIDKARCKANLPGACSEIRVNGVISTITAASIDEYCQKRASLSNGIINEDQCKTFTDPQAIIDGHDDWYDMLDRNYRHHEKAMNQKAGKKNDAVNYNQHGYSGIRYGEQGGAVEVAAMVGMAPKHLIDRVKGFDNAGLAATQKDKFRTWNVVGFEGGGSSEEYTTSRFDGRAGITNSETKKTRDSERKEISTDHQLSVTGTVSFKVPLAGVKTAFNGAAGVGGTTAYSLAVTRETTITEDSDAMFHLEDPNFGDYFVVSVYSDPDFGTPLFSLDSGAASCQWEVGAAHRSAPTLAWEYIGPDVLGPDDTAPFRVTLGNSINYYQAGPDSKDRPGWMAADVGYVPPNMIFGTDPYSLYNGIAVKLPKVPFEEFGKGTIDVAVFVSRGPKEYSYPYITLRWYENCGGPTGENLYAHRAKDSNGIPYYALSMPNKQRSFEFTPECPHVDWSGRLLTDQGFSVLYGDSTSIDVAVAFSDAVRPIVRVGLEHRIAFDSGLASSWVGFATNEQTVLGPQGGGSFYSGTWKITESMADGNYEVRVVAECSEGFSTASYDSSVTSTLRGVVDRVVPELLSFVSTSLSNVYATGDHFVLTFSEDIVCTGFVNADVRADLELRIDFGTVATYVVGGQPGNLDYACKGNTITVSAPPFTVDVANEIAAKGTHVPIKVTLSGLTDTAGNSVAKDTTKVMTNGRAGEERAELIAGQAEVKTKINALNQSYHHKIDALLAKIDVLGGSNGAAAAASAEAAKAAEELRAAEVEAEGAAKELENAKAALAALDFPQPELAEPVAEPKVNTSGRHARAMTKDELIAAREVLSATVQAAEAKNNAAQSKMKSAAAASAKADKKMQDAQNSASAADSGPAASDSYTVDDMYGAVVATTIFTVVVFLMVVAILVLVWRGYNGASDNATSRSAKPNFDSTSSSAYRRSSAALEPPPSSVTRKFSAASDVVVQTQETGFYSATQNVVGEETFYPRDWHETRATYSLAQAAPELDRTASRGTSQTSKTSNM